MSRFESIWAKSSTARPSRLARRAFRIIARPFGSLHAARIAANPGHSTRDHIFVLGVPRAGTSLLATILSCHPNVVSAGDETDFFRVRGLHYLDLPGLPRETFRQFLSISSSKAELFDRVASYYQESKHQAARFLEKTPGHGFHLEKLMDTFPKSHFLFLVREPRDAYASLCRSEELPNPSLEGYANRWNTLVRTQSKVSAERVRLLRYEDLVSDPEKEVRALSDFLGLEYHTGMLDPESHALNSAKYAERKYHARLGTEISPRSIESWRTTLDKLDSVKLWNATRAEAERLGYSE
jgi:protein-tyrosine sulfotransferase